MIRLLARKNVNRTIKFGFIVGIGGLLMACNGADTVANPFTNAGGLVNEGPPPATEDVRKFQLAVWNNLKASNRCGQCHAPAQAAATYPFADASNVNTSYASVIPFVNQQDPANSILVTKVGSGHQCWEPVDSVCADSIENMITNWVGQSDDTTARIIQLTAPDVLKNPGDSKNFPGTAGDNGPDSFTNTIHPLLTANCIACHYEEGTSQQQAPFFANPDPNAAYEAAKSKLNIDFPIDSRLVQRLLGGHNCWSDCGSYDPDTEIATGNANEMLSKIKQFAGAIPTTTIDVTLITSKAMKLSDGIIASGGNRHESNMIALWEFKAGTGNTAFDTSGIEPAVNVSFVDKVTWLDNYGLSFSGGKAQADTAKSKKLNDFIKSSGEYSIETWAIPGNLTQEDASLVSYDAGATNKNFALTQFEYNYRMHNRTDQTDANGEPFLSTLDAGEIVQSSLQHVVATYDPVAGRRIYVNGEEVPVTDPISVSTSITSWDDTFAFVMGNSSSNDKPWMGQLRMVAIHNRVLTAPQILQNFDVGVGQKYFLLFSIAHQIGIADSYILFQVSQFDGFSYLFENPTFINLNSDWVPTAGLNIQRIRLGINGKQALAGQSFANLKATINSSLYAAGTGQQLSSTGTGAVIALEKGALLDEFFLTFELLDGKSKTFPDPAPTPPVAGLDAPKVSDIGVRTFDEINAAISSITGIPITNSAVSVLFTKYRQQLPSVETIDAFLSSQQMAIAQLALTSCSARVDLDSALPTSHPSRVLFTDVEFSESSGTAFNSSVKRALVINPILDALIPLNLNSQPDRTEITNLLGATVPQFLTGPGGAALVDPDGDFTDNSYSSLISTLNNVNSVARTSQIVKAVCAAVVGSAAMLVQ